jgi:hypothetical protein
LREVCGVWWRGEALPLARQRGYLLHKALRLISTMCLELAKTLEKSLLRKKLRALSVGAPGLLPKIQAAIQVV